MNKVMVSVFVLLTLALVLVGQQPVEVRRITAPATGTQVAASSDSVVCATDTGCVVKQATGTNLHAVIDTGSTTAVTQATAANLNATVVGTGTFATQAALRTTNSTSTTFSTITCDNYIFDRSSTADVSLVAISGSTVIYVCGYRITGEATTASDVSLEYGTGATCGTGTANLTPPTTIGTGTSGLMIAGVAIPPGVWAGLKTPAAQRLCVHRSAVQISEVEVWYTQF